MRNCLRIFLYDRAKSILESLTEKQVNSNINLVIQKIHLFLKLGNFDKCQAYIKKIMNEEVDYPWYDSEEKEIQLKYQMLRMYQ